MRVTLWKCPVCGVVKQETGLSSTFCGSHTPAVPREPIEFAPLPSEETRETALAILSQENSADAPLSYLYESQMVAAISELEECWK